MCCVPICHPVDGCCLDPDVIWGGGISHTHANGYRESRPMGFQPSGSCVATSYEAGKLVYRLDQDSVTAAACKASSWLGECRLNVFGRINWTCVPPQGKARAHYSIQGTGNVDWIGERNVWMSLRTEALLLHRLRASLTDGELPGTRFQSKEIQISPGKRRE